MLRIFLTLKIAHGKIFLQNGRNISSARNKEVLVAEKNMKKIPFLTSLLLLSLIKFRWSTCCHFIEPCKVQKLGNH